MDLVPCIRRRSFRLSELTVPWKRRPCLHMEAGVPFRWPRVHPGEPGRRNKAGASRNEREVRSGDAEAAAPPVPTRPLRRDAERNRQLIIGAAKVVFAQRGLEASLDEIAKEAGLGVGTVYRRFPNRDALIEALLDDTLVSIARIVDEAAEAPRVGRTRALHHGDAGEAGSGQGPAGRDDHAGQAPGRMRHSQGRSDPRHGRARRLRPDRRAQQEGDLREDVSPPTWPC